MAGLKLVILVLALVLCISGENVTMSNGVDVISVDSCTQAVLVSGIKLTTFANDSRKYVECVGIGLGVERSCVVGSVFDIDKMGCVLDEVSLVSGGENSNSTTESSPVVNTTTIEAVSQVRAIDTVQVAPRDVLVVKNETWCRNGGESHGNSSCICLAGFTGVNCETELRHWSVVGHLNNNTFDYEVYSRVVNESVSKYETILDRLIESIWSELSGEDAYIHSFNYTSLLNQTHNMGRRLHRLSLYTRQDLLNFEVNFKLYVKALDKLGDYFEANETVRSDAVRFTNQWIRVNNLTAATNETEVVNATESSSSSSSPLLRASILCRKVMNRIRDRLNVTHDVASEFYSAYLNRSHFDFDFDNYTHVLANLTERNWNAIVNYGFWRVTRRLSGIEHFGEFGIPVLVREKRSVKEKDDDSAVFKGSQTDMDLSLRAFVDSRSFDRKFSPKTLRKFLADLDK